MEKKSIILFAIYLGFFANAVVFTVVIPFASKMVTTFGMADDRESTGTWVGIITFSLMFGRAITSPFWGAMCDKWGRRPVTIIGMFSICIFSLIFGFSQNFIWAMASRFLLGVMTPLTVVVKTLLSEMCPGEEQSHAMAWQIILGQLGSIAGNILGGLLEDPKSSGLIESGIFADYPFLLPNFVASLMAIIALLILYPTLEETLHKDENHHQLIVREDRTFCQIAADPLVNKVLAVFIILSLNSTAFHELICLWCWASIEKGGFEMNPNEIGIVLGVSSTLLLIFQKPLYHWMVVKYGLVGVSAHTLLLAIPLLFGIPIASLVNREDAIKWISVIFICMAWFLVNFITFTSISVLSNNTVIAKERGRVNGLFMTIGSFARSISPLFFGFTFSTTVEHDWIFPFNFAFSFYIVAFLSIYGWIICKRLPESLNRPIVLEDAEKTSTQMITLNK